MIKGVRRYFRRLESEIKEQEKTLKRKRFRSSKEAGKYGENKVKIEIWKAINWVGTIEETDAQKWDIFAAHPEPPMMVALVQVKSLFGKNRTVHVYEDDISQEEGPVWVFLVETKPEKYAYLVFSYEELRDLARSSKFYDYPNRRAEYDIIVPKSLEGFEKYEDAWHKIEENALVSRNSLTKGSHIDPDVKKRT